MALSSRRAPVALLLLLAACAAPPASGDASGEARQPIVGGTVDSGDPAVVLLVSYPQDLSVFDTCTASVISSTALLTAAHCVDAPNHPGYGYGVFPGPDASAFPTLADLLPQLLAVKEVHAHPSYDPAAPFHADLGVVLLEQPVATAPLPVNRVALGPSTAGAQARIIGYGEVVPGQFNAVKHDATTLVQSIGADDTIVVGDASHRSCLGDSGGPALVAIAGVETIVGADSYAAAGCTQPANYRRPDLYLPFLDTYAPPPPPPADAGPDSGGEVDAGPDAGSGGGGTHGGGGGGAAGGPDGGLPSGGSGGGAGATAGAGGLGPQGTGAGTPAAPPTPAAQPSKGGCALAGGSSPGRDALLAATLLALAVGRRRVNRA